MERFFRGVIHMRKLVVTLFIVAIAICAMLIPQVSIDYDFSDYLPTQTPSTVSLRTMQKAFSSAVPNARLYVADIDIVQAGQLAKDLGAIDGVSGVMWLGDFADVQVPLEMQSQSIVDAWYADGGYLYQLTVDTSSATGAVETKAAIEQVAGGYSSDIALSGDAMNTATAQGSSDREIQLILLMSVLVVFGLLLLTSESWFEPVLFVAVIGASIVLNLGTNIFRGQISFITQMCASILQLAVSMDYGIVMLHTYRRIREQEGLAEEDAMVKAIRRSFSTIASSAATTFFGFLSLVVMVFLVGADMGIVLAKGIAFSFISVLLLMPCLIILCRKPLDKTRHRALLPPFKGFARFCIRIGPVTCVLIALLAVPAFLGQSHLNYTYGASGFVEPGSRIYEDTQRINGLFGASETWVVLVPEGQWQAEGELIDDLEQLPLVGSVTAYDNAVGTDIPTAVIDDSQLTQLISGGYSRLVVSTKVEKEGQTGFNLVQQVRDICAQHFDEYYLVGASATTYDMSTTVSEDSLRVFLASIIAIGLVLVLMFRSISLPILLLLSIEVSIWMNLAIPYFAGSSVQYIGYLIISSIMLGATVDYTIILTRAYLLHRRVMPARDAMLKAMTEQAITILTSASILTLCGIFIGVISSNGVLSELGTLIGRGAVMAAICTFFFLPTLLRIFDRVIRHTSIGLKMYDAGKPGGNS